MIPRSITRRDIRKATREIDRSGVPVRRTSYQYDLQIGGRRYPPKLVISIAAKRSLGKEFSPKRFNAVEAKNFLIRRGFLIIKKTKAGDRFIGKKVQKEDAKATFAEGKARYKMHRTRERDPRVAEKAKNLRLQEQGELRCEICDFCFADTYGPRGFGYIEAHHTLPVSKLGEKAKTALRDIALVCANCHRILHKTKPWLSITTLRKIVKKNSEYA